MPNQTPSASEASRSTKVGFWLLFLFILSSFIVLAADALGPGHILDNSWTKNESFHYIWLWMFSWLVMPFCMYALVKSDKFTKAELRLAYGIPTVMWVTQLCAVVLYWVNMGIDPFPVPVRVAGIRVDWPGVIVSCCVGFTGYWFFINSVSRAQKVTALPKPFVLWGYSFVLLLTGLVIGIDTTSFWYGSAQVKSSQHGLFHALWANINLSCFCLLAAGLLQSHWSHFRKANNIALIACVAPWLAYFLAPLAAGVFGIDLVSNHLLAQKTLPVHFGAVAGIALMAISIVLWWIQKSSSSIK